MDEETIKWILSDQTVDPVSKVQYAAVVFMLYYSLELKHNLLKTSEQLMQDLPTDISYVGDTSLYVAGSAAQGFYLHTNDYLEARDIDIVAVYEKDIRAECEYDKEDLSKKINEHLNVGDEDHRHENENAELCEDKVKTVNITKESDPSYLNIETWEDTYPGYVMLRKCRKSEIPVQPSLRNRYVSSFETTQARTDFWRDVLSYLGDEFHYILDHPRDKEADVLTNIQTQGPATSVSICHRFMYLCIDADLVYALRYPRFPNTLGMKIDWPEIARKWLQRIPESGWPSAKLKSDIVSSGCLLVPKGHMGSKREDYEWRISFSLAELKLARSLNRIQREIAHTLKAMLCEEQYEYGNASVNAKLDSYFILNILFAESEIIAPEAWQEKNIASVLYRLLDKLAASIRTKNLPNYFVEENNLLYKLLMDEVKIGKGEFKRGDNEIDEMMNSDEYTDFALYTVLRLRHDPLGQLLQQASYHRLPHALHDAVFGPFVKEAKLSSLLQPTIYASTLVKLANAHLYMNNFKEASIYIKDAEVFSDALGAKDQSNLRSESMITKAVCSYMDGEYNTALQLLEGIHQNKDGMHAKILNKNEMTVAVLLVRALISDAATNHAANKKSMRAKAKTLLENVLSLNFDTRVALELINFFMLYGLYPEAYKLLRKMKDYIIEDDDNVVEPIEEDPESRVYYGEAYTVPVVEEPIYVVHHWEAEEDDDLDKDTVTVAKACKKGDSEELNKNNVVDDVCISTEIESNEPALEAKSKYIHAAESEAEMDLEISETAYETTSKTSDVMSSFDHGYNELKSKEIIETKALSAEEPEVLVDDMMVQEEQQVSTSDFGSVDMTHSSVIGGSDYENKQDSDNLADEEGYIIYRRSNETVNQFDSIMQDNEMDYSPILYFYENQDLINLSALARAFTELGLDNDAQRVRNRVIVKVKQRQKVDKTVTVDALEHDLAKYMSVVENPHINEDWDNPLSIFSEDVLYTTADLNILDEILKSLVQNCKFVRLKVNDLYFHYHIQLLKFNGKISEAFDMVKHITNEDLKSIHFKALGYHEEAALAESMASYKPRYEPVYNMVSKWMKKLIDAVGKFEPRNTYLESVFN